MGGQVNKEREPLPNNGNGNGKRTLFHMTWGTLKEKDFIDKMGSFYTGNAIQREPDPKKRYYQLLLRYREGMKHRVNWGDIDPIAIKQYVEWRLARQGSQC